jgi:uncharacterized protein YbaP (TraB family)
MAILRLLIYLTFVCSSQVGFAGSDIVATVENNENENPRTLLWKVSGLGLSKPSYLLGINHIVSAEWLYGFPEIKAVIESADLLMTELYGDNETAILGNTKEADTRNREKVNIRAVDLMTPEQFATLDSFFI